MPSRRGAIAMTPEERLQFIEEGWTLQVATIGHKGYPHLVAMWYVMDDDGSLVFTTFRKSQKVLNLRRDPKITAMLESGRGYAELRGLVIEGEGVVEDDVQGTARVMAMVGKKYNGIPIPTETPEAALQVASKRVVVRIREVESYSWDHRKLGGRY